MKIRRGWIAAAGIAAATILMFELGNHMHGEGWAMYLASGCVLACYLAGCWALARWADNGESSPRD